MTHRGYYVGAREEADDGYALLRAALTQTERAATGRRVFHDRRRTVVIRTVGTCWPCTRCASQRSWSTRAPSSCRASGAARASARSRGPPVQSAGGALAMRAYGM